MMMVANPTDSEKLLKLTKWTCLYWWNMSADGWKLESHAGTNPKLPSVPAYNFDFLFEKLRPVFQIQDDKELLTAFKLLIQVENPADSLTRLAIMTAERGLIK